MLVEGPNGDFILKEANETSAVHVELTDDGVAQAPLVLNNMTMNLAWVM